MREIDKAFLALFKDLKIVQDRHTPETDGKPNYNCFIGGNAVSHKEVVRLVKRYQDAIVDMLIQNNEGDNTNA